MSMLESQATYEMKERREFAKERVRAYKEDRKLLVQASRQEEQKKIKESLEDNQIQARRELDKVSHLYTCIWLYLYKCVFSHMVMLDTPFASKGDEFIVLETSDCMILFTLNMQQKMSNCY